MWFVPLALGQELPARAKEPVSKVQLLMYAGASGDYNLIHTDAETAKAMGLGDVIAHGMLSMGFLGQYVTDLFGVDAVRCLGVRFSGMVRLGDVLTCKGVVKAVPFDHPRDPAGRRLVTLEVWAENQAGEPVTKGDAEVWYRVAHGD